MKVRDSGMPPEEMWSGFFQAELVLRRLGLTESVKDMVDFGSGYGTFSIPAAKVICGTVHALDIEEEMVAAAAAKARAVGVSNIVFHLRDFVSEGSGLAPDSVDYATLFNILHAESPQGLLREAHRVLRPPGSLAVIHWIPDASTPRGPELAIRPTPEQCVEWATQAGFKLVAGPLDLPPYHFGLQFTKPPIV